MAEDKQTNDLIDNTELFRLWVQYEFSIINSGKALRMLEDYWKKKRQLVYYMTDTDCDVGAIDLMNITELVLRVAPKDRVKVLEKVGQIMQLMRDAEVGYNEECCFYDLIFEEAE